MSKYYSQDILYYIDAILKYSNYGKAAKSLYISQPHLTQVIKRIENQLNCELISRNKLPYRLTEQGKIYYQYLTSIENNYAKLLREISAASDIDNKVIKIGVLPSLGTYLLPLFLPRFLDMHPNCGIELSEDLPEKNEKLTQNGELDFWIGQNSRNISPNLNSITWGRHRYCAIIPRCCNLYQKDVSIIPEGTIDINLILHQKLILTSKGSAIRKQIDQLLSIYKVEPKVIIESTEIHTVRKLATSNLGVTFIPESIYVKECSSEYNIYQIPIDELNLDYFIAYHNKRKLTGIDKDLIDAFLIHGQNN
ncbi:LysR substrate-binding domain-containing protein [Clostridium saccharoperbutylacetonicum]|uniref:LysR substrate-binding domain-containing protein n=1 Tax=Clostridium saccharoperbutylacetonicum TaxID=36745 RepID=UPI0039E9991F